MERDIVYKGIYALLLSVLGIIFSPTIAEFFVALVNRYRTYPVGLDTNMLANTTILQVGIVLVTFIPLLLIFKKFGDRVIYGATVVFLLFVWLSMFIPSFLPFDWCQRELRIYSCESQLQYQR